VDEIGRDSSSVFAQVSAARFLALPRMDCSGYWSSRVEGGRHGQGDRVLHTDALSQTVEDGSAGAVWKNYRIWSAGEKIGLASEQQVQRSITLQAL